MILFSLSLITINIYSAKFSFNKKLENKKNKYITIILFVLQYFPYLIYNLFFVENASLILNIVNCVYVLCLTLFYIYFMKRNLDYHILIYSLIISTIFFVIVYFIFWLYKKYPFDKNYIQIINIFLLCIIWFINSLDNTT